MIMLKFPKVHKLLDKSLLDLEDESPKKGVCVMKDHAVVVNNHSIVCFNLHDYFVIKEKKTDSEELKLLSEILEFMDGKRFSFAFWEELTKGALFSIVDGKLHLEGSVKKDLIHDYVSFTSADIVQQIRIVITSEEVKLQKNSFYMDSMIKLCSALGSMMKNDSICFEFLGVNTGIRFVLNDNPWVFGVLNPDSSFVQRALLFDDMNSFYHEIK